jgi:hypothetical protein
MKASLVLLAAAALMGGSFAQDKSTGVALGAMHFSATEMDSDNDGIVSEDEFMKYHMAVWDKMTQASAGKMSLVAAAAAFARGGMHVDASKMDPNNDGIITRDEFMHYEATHWALLPKDANGAISVTDLQNAMQKHRKEAAAVTRGAAKSD